LIGAAILITVVVLLAPALLDGGPQNSAPLARDGGADRTAETKVVVLKTPQPVAPVPVTPGPASPADVAPAAGSSRPAADRSQQADRPAKPAPAAPPTGFAVQLGSFAERPNAERYAAQVSAEGFAVFVIRAATDNLQVYRVYAGPEGSREQAGELAERLQRKGHSVMIVELDNKRG
jgi:cell division protein FtsN